MAFRFVLSSYVSVSVNSKTDSQQKLVQKFLVCQAHFAFFSHLGHEMEEVSEDNQSAIAIIFTCMYDDCVHSTCEGMEDRQRRQKMRANREYCTKFDIKGQLKKNLSLSFSVFSVGILMNKN